MEAAQRRLSEFVGREIGEFVEIDVPNNYAVGYALGEIPELHYIAERDGEVFHFNHEFKEASRPLLIVSHDGEQLIIAGGRYNVTDKGIEDR